MPRRKRVQKRFDFRAAHLTRVTFPVKEDVAAGPVDVGLSRLLAVMPAAAYPRYLVDKAGWALS